MDYRIGLLSLFVVLAACEQEVTPPAEQQTTPQTIPVSMAESDSSAGEGNPLRNAYFGGVDLLAESDNVQLLVEQGYYARVLEIPTPRWSTYDAVRHNLPLLEDVQSTIQERAWTSPIWYTP